MRASEPELPEVLIRPAASVADREACARLMASSEPWITLGRSYAASLGLLEDPTRELYVAERAGRLVGFVVINMHGLLRGYIQTVCVSHEERGKRLGTTLIRGAEDRIFRESPNVFLCVSTFNQDALRLYQRLGYEVVGELRDYFVPGHGEILMRKTRGPWTGFEPAPRAS
ncbi:MAG TPA: GNAT family N-acetyltransferase [Gemmatimonadales bacterium]|jgi:ribosomal protein S18 acetylase RimI-like enzyme|nr:GNAT family N-acetyltransferase [Gemmatimonadales bacterium]